MKISPDCAVVAIPVLLLVALIVAHLKDKKLHLQQPDALPFSWGYFFGYAKLYQGALALILLLALPSFRSEEIFVVLCLVGFFVIQSVLGWFIVKRQRWAWIVGSLTSLNLIIYIVNFIYGSHRWHEFEWASDTCDVSPSSGDLQTGRPVSSGRRKSSVVDLVCAVGILLLVAWIYHVLRQSDYQSKTTLRTGSSDHSAGNRTSRGSVPISNGVTVPEQQLVHKKPLNELEAILGPMTDVAEGGEDAVLSDEVILVGWPKVSAVADSVEAKHVPIRNPAEFQCLIVRRGDQYYWRSRENKEMKRYVSGQFEWFVSESSGYVKRLLPNSPLRKKDEIDYTEHISSWLGSITYWGTALTSKE